MKRKPSSLPELSPAQSEIMEIVWERGEVSASEVQILLASRRKVARNTVRTLLERMEEKGWLEHREDGRTYLYSATRPRQVTIGQKVLSLLDESCGGSPETLLAALIDYRGLSTAELERVRAMLKKAKADKGRG